MNESKHYERAKYSRVQIEAVVDRLLEVRLAEDYESIAYEVDALPAALHKPVIYALVHIAAGVPL